jgi:hypothetical protein
MVPAEEPDADYDGEAADMAEARQGSCPTVATARIAAVCSRRLGGRDAGPNGDGLDVRRRSDTPSRTAREEATMSRNTHAVYGYEDYSVWRHDGLDHVLRPTAAQQCRHLGRPRHLDLGAAADATPLQLALIIAARIHLPVADLLRAMASGMPTAERRLLAELANSVV